VTGVVDVWNEVGRYAFIVGDDGERYFAGRAHVIPDELGRLVLFPGETVSFRQGKPSVGKLLPEATDVQAARIDESQSPPPWYKEELIVTEWNPVKRSGLCARANGEPIWIYLNEKAVITFGEIQVGTRLWSGIRRARFDPRKFQAVEAEVMMEIQKEQ
jgi:hypothetical protein